MSVFEFFVGLFFMNAVFFLYLSFQVTNLKYWLERKLKEKK